MKYNRETAALEISVRELCELALLFGDIGGYVARDSSEARLSAELVNKLQAGVDGFYNTDVTLSNTQKIGDVYFTVEECADGIVRRADGSAFVDTVRMTRGYDFSMPVPETVIARMKCLCYFLLVRDRLEYVNGRVTVYNTDSGKIRYINYKMTEADLKPFYMGLLSAIYVRAKTFVDKETLGRESAASAPFPYRELREGQELMVREGYLAIKKGRRIFVEAPTGTGKTVSSLYPALRAFGENRIDRVFYLTSKVSIRREAYLASAKLFEAGVKLRTIVLTAKEQMCACPSGPNDHCDPDLCRYAKGYYERSRAAIDEMLSSYNGYPRGLVYEIAMKHGVCPYELSLDLSLWCDIIICDYNYAFDPSVYLRRYFSDRGERGRYVFLVDEAHNLADRARDMYSSSIRLSSIKAFRDKLDEFELPLVDSADRLIYAIEDLKHLCDRDTVKDADGNEEGFYLSKEPLGKFNKELDEFRKKCDAQIKGNRDVPMYREIRAISSDVRRYLSVNEFFDKGFLSYVELYGGDVRVKTYCLDPSSVMDRLMKRAGSAILFSATLTPPEYFCDVLGCRAEAGSISLPSPFPPDNFCVAAVDYLSCRAEDRKKNYAKYATVIAATVSAKEGNYIAYFPSYECLEGVKEIFCKKYPRVSVIAQSRGMGNHEKEEFLSNFKNDEGRLRIGFCVLGGAFAEGVDLPENRLIGVVVFGVGIPALSNERNIIMEYFNNTVGMGYEYAYTYPGMNRVLQAVGRVIRREGDKGIAVLVDDRYAEPKYRNLFPKHWNGVQYAGNARSIAEIMRRFWEKSDNCE